jgi:hypothetical protein
VPDDWKRYTDDAGWSVAAPATWDTSTTSRGELQIKDPDTRATLRVKVINDPPADANALTDSRKRSFMTLGKYAELKLEASQVGDLVANDLEFTFYDTVDLHVLDRSFITGGRGYSLYWQTPGSQWEASRATFDQIVASFTPAPSG